MHFKLWFPMPYFPTNCAVEQAMAYTWSMIGRHAAPVFGWLSRDPVVGCDTSDEMAETILEHIFME